AAKVCACGHHSRHHSSGMSVISGVPLRPKLYVPYWILVSLFVAQAVAVCFTHCLTARLALCDTLFLVVALSSKGFECTENASGVLRSAALIAFEGLIFANFTHAAQMLVERHDEGVHLKVFRTMPPIFGDIPSNFRLEEFKAEINAKFCSAYCQHIHVYRRWPMDSFDAFLSVAYRCSTAEPNWEQKAQANIVRIQNEIRSVLVKAGARRVTVEPLITQETPSTHWQQCINDHCRMKSCC
uniref:Uncharacterized protein n=1 Tax=Parascaris univalens TaxID=6257 RepID=A0A914ZDW4_PARUN